MDVRGVVGELADGLAVDVVVDVVVVLAPLLAVAATWTPSWADWHSLSQASAGSLANLL